MLMFPIHNRTVVINGPTALTMAYEWKNKVVLITGGAIGIGAAVIRLIVGEGVKHVRVLDINEKAGIELQNELNSKYGANKVKFAKCDVTNEEQFIGLMKAVAKEEGLDVVINNAGVMNDSLEVYKKALEINVTALATGTIRAMELMSKEHGGRGGTIINISSIAALFINPIFPVYMGAKSFVLQFSNCIGTDEYYLRTGVRVVTVCFGATDTGLLHTNNVGNFDPVINATLQERIAKFPIQTVDNAAQGLVEAFKKAKSGSTWIATTNRPVKDITPTVTKAYDLLSVHVFE